MEFLHLHVPLNYLAMNNTQYIIIYHRPTRCGFTLCPWGRMELLKLTGRQIFCLFLSKEAWQEYETARGVTEKCSTQLERQQVSLTLTKVHCKQFSNDPSYTLCICPDWIKKYAKVWFVFSERAKEFKTIKNCKYSKKCVCTKNNRHT